MKTNHSENLVYCWTELNKLLSYLLSTRYPDVDKVKRAKVVAFDICFKFAQDYEKEAGKR